MKWQPLYQMTPKIAHELRRIEAMREKAAQLDLGHKSLRSFREIVRLCTVYHSTIIEGNCLEPDQITAAIKKPVCLLQEGPVDEVKGYYEALLQVERWTSESVRVNEAVIRQLHAILMSGGSHETKPSCYRSRQNVVYNNRTSAIAYMPPDAKAVSGLMKQLIRWIDENAELSCPIVASVAYYQLLSIHPYYHGNGRVARLVVSLILYACNKDLHGLYSLEKYFTSNLNSYYSALSISPSHNYYSGREKADLTPWIQYFVEGVASSFEESLKQIEQVESNQVPDLFSLIQKLDPKQRKALDFFREFTTVEASLVQES